MEIFDSVFTAIWRRKRALHQTDYVRTNGKPNQNRITARYQNWNYAQRRQQRRTHSIRPQSLFTETLLTHFDIFISTQVSMLARLVSNAPCRAVPGARRAISVQVPTSPRARSRALTLSAVRAQSLLHGSKKAKEAGDLDVQHHSRLIARGKYLHGIESASRPSEKCPTPYRKPSCPQFIE
jgi:hypothetical protein